MSAGTKAVYTRVNILHVLIASNNVKHQKGLIHAGVLETITSRCRPHAYNKTRHLLQVNKLHGTVPPCKDRKNRSILTVLTQGRLSTLVQYFSSEQTSISVQFIARFCIHEEIYECQWYHRANFNLTNGNKFGKGTTSKRLSIAKTMLLVYYLQGAKKTNSISSSRLIDRAWNQPRPCSVTAHKPMSCVQI